MKPSVDPGLDGRFVLDHTLHALACLLCGIAVPSRGNAVRAPNKPCLSCIVWRRMRSTWCAYIARIIAAGAQLRALHSCARPRAVHRCRAARTAVCARAWQTLAHVTEVHTVGATTRALPVLAVVAVSSGDSAAVACKRVASAHQHMHGLCGRDAAYSVIVFAGRRACGAVCSGRLQYAASEHATVCASSCLACVI